MDQDLFKLIGILLFSFFLVYLVVKLFNLQANVIEGLTNPTSTTSTSGEAGTASNYADTIKSQTVLLQDSLLISKYRKEYESAIINLDDLINFSMLKLALDMKMDINKDMTNIEKINTLCNGKSSLNSIMKFLDKQ
jgi:hypothetical protein